METVALNGFREGLVKKYELLAWCYQKTEDRPVSPSLPFKFKGGSH